MSSAAGGQPVIEVSAVVIRRADGAVLTVRKRGTDAFMLPGGKPEPGETPAQTAARELAEELRIEIDPDDLRPLGAFDAAAANEAGTLVRAEVFEAPPLHVRGPAAEIEELRWLPVRGHRPAARPAAGAPVLIDRVLPLLEGYRAAPPAPSAHDRSIDPVE
ncbi:NUDIX domain-containing protein [Jatrophihabitans endophyticus]|uniref:NUDIX hydrolase n=1 Tax=Jatrophihabitans endophyticus TaxID=1206085 RepID=UPI001A0DDB1D|nr:NUDIX domain-containing protein [Jatrophihabitans endophyticus]MBE7189225.1 NUDIX domain-containing protein [Jatrophihabitans endophyticus]